MRDKILLFMVIAIALMMLFKEPLVDLLSYLLEMTHQKTLAV